MFDLIATVLASFYSVVGSYGLAIVLLTLAVMAVTSPLTYKGTKSMIQMQRLQPQLKAIQTKHRDDREKMNQEMLAFYKANNLNPVGGCLPLLIQIPVFLVLYRVVSGMTARFTGVGLMGGAAAMHASLDNPIAEASPALLERADRFNPAYLPQDSALYKDLSGATEMTSWGIDLSESASKALSQSFGHALPYLVLIALVLVTGVYQQRQIQGRQAKHGTGSPVNSQQQMIMKIMPFFLPIFSFTVPAALVVYFLVSNLWRIGQQAVITRTLYAGAPAPALPIEVDEVPAKPAPKTSRTPKSNPKADAPPDATDEPGTPSRSPMGRNRRAAEGGNGTNPARSRTRAPKPKPKPDRAPTASGRVTPPGTSARKKKRT